MALGDRMWWNGGWTDALGLAPGVAVLPHYRLQRRPQARALVRQAGRAHRAGHPGGDRLHHASTVTPGWWPVRVRWRCLGRPGGGVRRRRGLRPGGLRQRSGGRMAGTAGAAGTDASPRRDGPQMDWLGRQMVTDRIASSDRGDARRGPGGWLRCVCRGAGAGGDAVLAAASGAGLARALRGWAAPVPEPPRPAVLCWRRSRPRPAAPAPTRRRRAARRWSCVAPEAPPSTPARRGRRSEADAARLGLIPRDPADELGDALRQVKGSVLERSFRSEALGREMPYLDLPAAGLRPDARSDTRCSICFMGGAARGPTG